MPLRSDRSLLQSRDWPKWIALEILAEADKAMATSRRQPALAIHGFRRALKHWRALLRMLKPYLGSEISELRQQARKLSRRVADARDSQSRIDAFDDMMEAIPHATVFDTPFSTLHKRLVRAKTSAESRVWPPSVQNQVRNWLATARTRVLRWRPGHITTDQLALQISRQYRRARKIVPARWNKASVRNLHDLRRQIVDLELQMQILERLQPSTGGNVRRTAHRLRSRLGRHHDTALLQEFIISIQQLKGHKSELLEALRRRRARHRKSAEKIAKKLLKRKPTTFREMLTHAAGKIRPETKHKFSVPHRASHPRPLRTIARSTPRLR